LSLDFIRRGRKARNGNFLGVRETHAGACPPADCRNEQACPHTTSPRGAPRNAVVQRSYSAVRNGNAERMRRSDQKTKSGSFGRTGFTEWSDGPDSARRAGFPRGDVMRDSQTGKTVSPPRQQGSVCPCWRGGLVKEGPSSGLFVVYLVILVIDL